MTDFDFDEYLAGQKNEKYRNENKNEEINYSTVHTTLPDLNITTVNSAIFIARKLSEQSSIERDIQHMMNIEMNISATTTTNTIEQEFQHQQQYRMQKQQQNQLQPLQQRHSSSSLASEQPQPQQRNSFLQTPSIRTASDHQTQLVPVNYEESETFEMIEQPMDYRSSVELSGDMREILTGSRLPKMSLSCDDTLAIGTTNSHTSSSDNYNSKIKNKRHKLQRKSTGSTLTTVSSASSYKDKVVS